MRPVGLNDDMTAAALPKFHFLSGLPRSGSTVLSALLGQNPNISSGMTSPVFSFVSALLPQLSNANEFNVFVDAAARQRLLRGVFHSYYEGTQAQLVLDTNRHWTARIPLLLELFPDARFICCVRPLPQIVGSFENLFAANPAEPSRLLNFDAGSNIYSRVDHLMGSAGIVGFPLNALKEAFFGAWSERLMLISYANLCARPLEVLAAIYRFLDMDGFNHRLNDLAIDTADYDRAAGLPGLHEVRLRLSPRAASVRLPPDIASRLQGPYFWEAAKPDSAANLAFAR